MGIKNSSTLLVLIFVTAIVMSFALTGCNDNRDSIMPSDTGDVTTDADYGTELATDLTTDLEADSITETTTEFTAELSDESVTELTTELTAEEPTGIEIITKYITLYYPEEWQSNMKVAQSDDGTNYTVAFLTEISEEEIVLFSIVLGPNNSEGYLLGKLSDENAGEINVFSIMNEMESNGWSEEEYIEICSLQERVNDIIVQFYDDERFIPSR